LYFQGYWEIYPHLVGIAAPLPLIYGPLLYLYVHYSIRNERQLNRKDYSHFLPVLIAYLYMCRFYFFYSAEEKRLVDSGQIDDFGTFSNILVLAFVISGMSYSIYAYRLLDKHKLLLEHNFSNTDGINLNWLKSLIWGVGFLFLVVIIVLVTNNLMEINYPFNPDFIFYSLMVFGILALGYFGIRHENIFVDNIVVEVEEKTKAVYEKSGLTEKTATIRYEALLEFMAKQKPYLEPKLTLNTLAERLDISPNHLSQIINQIEEQNFNDFINKYRVEEFINRASQDTHLSYLALALESGFNSKSTFNAVFKKLKGVTPSQFMASKSNKASY
jgi:AraC-like DNA-binding protein